MMQHRHEHDDDAMFSKKPLGGVSCASCEKDLVNLYGKAADYHHWNRMPSRDPSERIARVGWFVGWLSPPLTPSDRPGLLETALIDPRGLREQDE